jgi:hypothetical protein
VPVISSQTETVTGAVRQQYFSRMQKKLFFNRKQENNFPENKSNALLIFQIINASEHGCPIPSFLLFMSKQVSNTHTKLWIFIFAD